MQIVQVATNGEQASGTAVATFTNGTQANNAIIVMCAVYGGSPTSVSDDQGSSNSYSVARGPDNLGGSTDEICKSWFALNVVAGTKAITVLSTGSYTGLIILEVSGLLGIDSTATEEAQATGTVTNLAALEVF